MPTPRVKLNHAAIHAFLTSQEAHDAVLVQALRVCEAANRWADAQHRSGRHTVERPHFEVVAEPSTNRARYTIRPRTLYATWLVQTYPAGLIAAMDAART